MVDSTGEHLLAEGHHVWGLGQVEVLVGPHLARWPTAGLNLVDEEGGLVLGADLLEALEVYI